MLLHASLSWLALGLTPGLASRLSARRLRQFGSPLLPQREQKAVREGPGGERDPERIPAANSSCTGKFSRAQPDRRLITARLALEFGREVFGVPGNVTQPVSFAPNQLIKPGAKLVTCADDVIEELPTPVRAALVQAEKPEADQRNLLAADGLNGPEKKLYELLSAEEPVHLDELVERSGLNSSEVLATLFTLEMKGLCGSRRGSSSAKCCYSAR